ncbi:MAG: rhomboid family intramembrane serine protease [Flavobacteriales bacterium]|nr:rhomboid family intramembrane serine protease [Flavobacteriales bacterium]
MHHRFGKVIILSLIYVMKDDINSYINTFFWPILFVIIIWAVKGIEIFFNINDLYFLGIQSGKNVYRIFTFPFIHSDFNHLINNTYPMMLLGGIISSVYRTISLKVYISSFILSGFIFWIIGERNEIYVIGASSFIYYLAGFVFFSGFIRKQPRLAILSFLVIFLNFVNIWGLIEIPDDNISQMSHLAGFISGLIIAITLKNQGPKPKKYQWEIDEEKEENEIGIKYIYRK